MNWWILPAYRMSAASALSCAVADARVIIVSSDNRIRFIYGQKLLSRMYGVPPDVIPAAEMLKWLVMELL